MNVTRMSRTILKCGTALSATWLLCGCTPKGETHSSLPQPPATRAAATFFNEKAPAQRLAEMQKAATALAEDSKPLPGNDEPTHSRLIQQVFADLANTLASLGNPTTDRILNQRIAILQTSRAQLGSGSSDLAIEPAIDTGLRAAQMALADLSHADAFAGADVGPILDQLSAQLSRLDLERDASLHRLDVAQSVDLMNQVVAKLTAAFSGQVSPAEPAK